MTTLNASWTEKDSGTTTTEPNGGGKTPTIGDGGGIAPVDTGPKPYTV